MKGKQKYRKRLLAAFAVLAMPLVLTGIISSLVLQLVAGGNMSASAGAICLAVVLVIVLIVIFFMTRQLLNRIHSIMGNLQQLADGTISMKEGWLSQRDDEIGQVMRSVNRMMVSFAQIIIGVSTATGSLVKVSEDIANSFADAETSMRQVGKEVNSIGMNTSFQSERTQEIGTQMMDMGYVMEMIAHNTDALQQSADKLKEYSQAAENTMSELAALGELRSKTVAEAWEQTDMVNQSAMQIRTVTDMMSEISGRASLLALNASIEVARAGEMGKGFAGVAEEIRALADRSKEFSEQINVIVNEWIGNSDASLDIIREVAEAFKEQAEKISRTDDIFVSLNQEIVQISGAVGEIVALAEDVEADFLKAQELQDK